MKKIINILKTLLYGIWPALAGGCIAMDVYYFIRNIQNITTHSSWIVIYYFILAAAELFLAIALLYECGKMQLNAKKWLAYTQYKELDEADNIDGSSDDCETSDEAADI